MHWVGARLETIASMVTVWKPSLPAADRTCWARAHFPSKKRVRLVRLPSMVTTLKPPLTSDYKTAHFHICLLDFKA